MTRTKRLCRIDQLLRSWRAINRRELLDALECSQSTLTRNIEYLLEAIQPGLLGLHIAPLRKRLEVLLGKGRHAPEENRRRILPMPANARRPALYYFGVCAEATLSRRRLRLRHHDRHLGRINDREVSPQRLVRYKENCYLDTWCRTAKRSAPSRSMPCTTPRSSTGPPGRSPTRSSTQRWRSAMASTQGARSPEPSCASLLGKAAGPPENWHVEQRSHYGAEGRYILKYGPQVEVLAPAELSAKVALRLREAAALYP